MKNPILYVTILTSTIGLKTYHQIVYCEFMPRNTTNKPKGKGAWPDVLRFVASLLFLYVIFVGTGASTTWSTWVTSGFGTVWLPILFGVAVLGSIGLFFSSLAGIVSSKARMNMSGKVLMWISLALVALTASPQWLPSFWVVLLGFLIGWLGTAVEMM